MECFILRYWEGKQISELKENQIFVFGSNPEGRHGAGAARSALSFGAKYGIGRGISGNSYAIPTKNLKEGFFEKEKNITYSKSGYRSLSKEQIISNILDLYEYAEKNQELEFMITYQYTTYINGSPKFSLNGYSSYEIMELFVLCDPPNNIIFHNSYKDYYDSKITKSNQ